MPQKIRVSILDDHQSIIDGYSFRLSTHPEIQVVATANYGDELEPMLAHNPTDVLLLDVTVPTSPRHLDPYPILHVIPRLLQIYDDLSILVISMHAQRALISAVMEAGANGYIFKDDQPSIRQLGAIVLSVTKGGIYLSHKAHMLMMKRQSDGLGPLLTTRQTEALSVCAAYPEDTSANLAKEDGDCQFNDAEPSFRVLYPAECTQPGHCHHQGSPARVDYPRGGSSQYPNVSRKENLNRAVSTAAPSNRLCPA